ncbi:DUF4465 domain-containing protein [Duncaniella freteri]|uniref:DUF4465 domain-containing protein n=4 Tax=Duncaniella TaxID=2518495 RepID=UPI00256F4CB1|nr:DUF4465 domain-containing protein [Duncaniella freteri]
MKLNFGFLIYGAAFLTAAMFTACSDDDDDQVLPGYTITTVSFDKVPESMIAVDEYGSNYYSSYDGEQVKSGYMARIGETDTYVQFPVNYLWQEWVPGNPWMYEFYNGGFVVSDFTNMTGADYKNQCSVYNQSGGHNDANFIVANGYSVANGSSVSYDKCAKIYLTDKTGYQVVASDPDQPVSGEAHYGTFNSVWVCNTTYSYLAMKDGNGIAHALKDDNGWFKVVFVAMDKNCKPTGKTVSYYLANFDASKTKESGLDNEIRTGWNKVDLSGLGDNVCTVAIDFEGSDVGAYGINTPAYVALDDLEIKVNE